MKKLSRTMLSAALVLGIGITAALSCKGEREQKMQEQGAPDTTMGRPGTLPGDTGRAPVDTTMRMPGDTTRMPGDTIGMPGDTTRPDTGGGGGQ